MSDTPVYLVANIFEISDRETYGIYESGFMPLLKKHGGELVSVDENSESLEGETHLVGEWSFSGLQTKPQPKPGTQILIIRLWLNIGALLQT